MDKELEIDHLKLELSAVKMYNALKVLLHSEKLRPLESNDIKAFEQARLAVQSYELIK